MTQHAAFDLGNVILEVDMNPFWQLVSELGVDEEDMHRFIRLVQRPEFCGLVDMQDLLEDEFEPYEADMLMKAWCDGLKPNQQMVNFLSSLRHEGFKIAFLSNIGLTHLNYIRENCLEMMSMAQVQHMSCEVGVAKPNLLYYQSFLMQHDDFAGCVYLDDRQENVVMGAKCKFDSIRFDLNEYKKLPPSVLKKELTRIRERLLRS